MRIISSAGLFAGFGALLPLLLPLPYPAAAAPPTIPLLSVNHQLLVAGVTYTTPVRGITHHKLAASRAAGPDQAADHHQPIRRVRAHRDDRGDANSRHSAASALGRIQRHLPGASYQNITTLNQYSTQYAVEIRFGHAPVWVIFDTGSSDTWAVRSDFRCVDPAGTDYPQAACRYGPDLIPAFGHGEIPRVHFKVQFGSGEVVSGPMGRSDVTTAPGLTVRRLQVGLANQTYWRGNNVTDGILGLAFTSLTSAYFGDPDEDGEQYNVPYAPFMAALSAQGALPEGRDYFSVAIDKGADTGVLAWGGLPPADMMVDRPVASADLIITEINPDRPNSAWQYSYYTVVIDGMQWGLTTDRRKWLGIVDTGTTLMYLPPYAIAAAFEPRAIFLWQYGSYFAPCDSVPPRLAAIVGGVHLWINSADLMYPGIRDPSTGYCQCGFASGGDGPYILGSTFLQSVVAVFDAGSAQMRFYGRA